ncbi:hypothetical protein CIPAW_13G114100 [Carya illinoinensis]|uniref:Uncharacterized protein n=1 Tax=Carya illinoinensis TaxID=32201 RepID=A0A8T1NRH3_CARIL|nr:hypothetical protein CIPAW_13G114100 [Carya illinoinensis]
MNQRKIFSEVSLSKNPVYVRAHLLTNQWPSAYHQSTSRLIPILLSPCLWRERTNSRQIFQGKSKNTRNKTPEEDKQNIPSRHSLCILYDLDLIHSEKHKKLSKKTKVHQKLYIYCSLRGCLMINLRSKFFIGGGPSYKWKMLTPENH